MPAHRLLLWHKVIDFFAQNQDISRHKLSRNSQNSYATLAATLAIQVSDALSPPNVLVYTHMRCHLAASHEQLSLIISSVQRLHE